MVFGNSSSAKSGDYGTSIVGDGNIINSVNFDSHTPKVLSRSLIFSICKTIAEMEIEYDDDYSIQQNSDWMEKFEYNNVNLYVDIFDNYSDGYDEVSKVLQGHLKKSSMIMKIRTVYLKVDNAKPEGSNGDYVISKIFDILKEEVCCQELLQPVGLNDEDVDAAIYLIMFYAFTKCKILEPVPKDD
ncbi:hypothetical protein B7C51_09795 [Paenibacillus larvae subsp. pulvifaciens]|uniref:Uncharacterized protein n=1 Tax=Paenibacillus larvae subsp. pulvifaciens TaxID=1477 RepID=A0A1V0USN5_9BACL|nr:hypothetical protein [Paenibacillus larvae]ARF68060.1 hypothetical protein B7C51_09795 [Paenibacillus larvae subsp. pulvifaciens]